MVEKISVQIALEGGQEVQRQLEGIGEAGQKAFEDISKSAEQVGGFKNLKPEEVTQKLEQLGLKGTEAFGKIQQAVQTAVRFETLVTGVSSVEAAFTALGRAAGPIGAVIAAAFIPAVKALSTFADSITKANAEAIKLGTTVEQFSRLQLALQQTGLAAKDVDSVFTKLGQAVDAAALGKVSNAFTELQDAAARGFGAQGTQQLRDLEEAAKGVGPAAKAAREDLVKLGLPIPMDVPKTLEELVAKTGDATRGLNAFITQLQQMPDGANRTKFAAQELGISIEAASRLLESAGGNLERFKQALAEQKPAGLITAEDLANAQKFQQALDNLTRAWDTFKKAVVTPLGTTALAFLSNELDGIKEKIATTQREWEALRSALSSITPSRGIIDMLTGTQREAEKTTQTVQQLGQAGAQAGQQGAQGFQSWDQILQKAGQGFQSWDQILQKAGQGFQSWDQILQKAGQGFQKTGQAAQQAGQAAAQTGQQGAQASQQLMRGADGVLRAEESVAEAFERKKAAALAAAAAQDAAAAQEAEASERTAAAYRNARAAAQQAAAEQAAAAQQALVASQAVARAAIEAALGYQYLAEGANTASQATANFMISVNGAMVVLQGFTELAARAAQFLANLDRPTSIPLLSQSRPSPIGSGFASGGLLGGRGTGTSDSNLAWVSRGEHIMPARAVSQPGVLDFLEALRRSGGNLRGVLDGLGRFALGGLVPRPALAFAAGGAVGSMSHVTIQFPGLQPIGGLRASAAVVDELRKAAALAQVRSGGRKPSRYS